jgi:succinate dehydrogenase/fumarate reductase flavoprotein subunit
MEVDCKEFTTDVLVVGSGIAGCFAAMEAKERGADVLMVEQGKSGFWGMSVGGTHRLRVVLPGDDFDAAMKGTVEECEYMIDQEFAGTALKETWDRFNDLLKFGVDFRRNDKGQILWYQGDTQDPHFKQRNAMWEPVGSYKHLLKINRQAVLRGVKVLDRVLATDLLTRDGKVQGAVGIDTRQGIFYVLKAKAVVIASGGFSGGGAGIYPHLTGDGIAMGLRAGAELRGMEFGKAETGGILVDRGCPTWVFVLLNPQEEEITITNARGEEFLEQYELGRRLEGRKYYGPPWRIQLMAMLRELREGRGPCYVDYRAPNKQSRLREFWGSYFDRTLKQIALTGTTLDQIKYELAIARGYNLGGGIRIKTNGESSVLGLYSGGQASDMCGTAQYTILSGMGVSMITGGKAGENAAQYAFSQSSPVVHEEQLAVIRKQIVAPFDHRQGVTPDEIHLKIRKAWLNVDLRNESRLKKAHDEFGALRGDLANLVASDSHELVKCLKIRNYLDCSDAVAVAALARRETRLEHIREDYPLTDNKEWLKWVIVHNVEDELQTRLEDIPISRWKYKPEPALIDRLRLKKGAS